MRIYFSGIKPIQATDGAAGYDLVSNEPCSITIGVERAYSFRTGTCVEIPKGYVGMLRGRSGLAFKHGVFAVHGTIDSDYRGEIKALLYMPRLYGQHTEKSDVLIVEPGMRICQLLIVPCETNAEFVETSQLGETERGAAGFGSTGM